MGRFLRKLRIDNDELLRDMAVKLDVSPSMLSAIENGKRRASESLVKTLIDRYTLSPEQTNELQLAVAKAREQVSISFAGLNDADRGLAVAFARKFNDLDDESKKRIRRILGDAND